MPQVFILTSGFGKLDEIGRHYRYFRRSLRRTMVADLEEHCGTPGCFSRQVISLIALPDSFLKAKFIRRKAFTFCSISTVAS